MSVFLLCLLLGFGGLSLMAVLGLGHHHGPGHAHAHPAGSFKAGAPREGHAGHTGHHSGGRSAGAAMFLAQWLSPRVLFGLLLGFGAAGLIAQSLIPWAWIVMTLAVAGAVAFEAWIAQPLWNTLLHFASTPAKTLEAAILEEGRAATNFDDTGSGLVALEFDGRMLQVLGTLCPEERENGQRVRSGDRLFIRSVDARRNTCTVSKLV